MYVLCLQCIDSLQDEQVANVDILLKWFTLRFYILYCTVIANQAINMYVLCLQCIDSLQDEQVAGSQR